METKQEKKSKAVNYSHIVRRIEGLSAPQKLLMYHLASAANLAGESWYSRKKIVRQTGMDKDTLTKATRVLVEMGLIFCESGKREGKPNQYRLLLDAMTALIPKAEGDRKTSQGVTEKPVTLCEGGDRKTSHPVTEKPVRGVTEKPVTKLPLQVHSEVPKVKTQGTNEVASPSAPISGGFKNGILDVAEERGTPPQPPQGSSPAESVPTGVPRHVRLSGNAPDGRPWSEWQM
jgi:DNA-binding transcriptional ArsR family regulator